MNDSFTSALSVQNQVYIAAAKLVTKIGDGQLAWIAADRAVNAAMQASRSAPGPAGTTSFR